MYIAKFVRLYNFGVFYSNRYAVVEQNHFKVLKNQLAVVDPQLLQMDFIQKESLKDWVRNIGVKF